MRFRWLWATVLTAIVFVGSVLGLEVFWLLGRSLGGRANATLERVPGPQETLKLHAPAPDFCLTDPTGTEEFRLSSMRNEKPVVLIFGSLSCPWFCSRSAELEKLYQAYKNQVEFRFIYVAEAHPGARVWVEKDGKGSFKYLEQTHSPRERSEIADICTKSLTLTIPTLVDQVDNAVARAYGALPVRLVVVHRDGRIAYEGSAEPVLFRPDELEGWLAEHASADSSDSFPGSR